MIRTKHIPSSFTKELNRCRVNPIVPVQREIDYAQVSLLLKEPADQETDDRVAEKKLPCFQKHSQREQFKEWRMPDQSTGYIRASKHGLL
jgi:hypothetical protein